MHILVDTPPTLVISGGTSIQERLTAALKARVIDEQRRDVTGKVDLYYDTSNASVVDVITDDGDLLAVGPGTATITVMAATKPCKLFTVQGMPYNPLAVAEVPISVLRHQVPKDFWFQVEYDKLKNVFTIHQRPAGLSVFNEGVTYNLGTRNLGTLTGGRGSLTFTGPGPNTSFIVRAQSESGIAHEAWTSWFFNEKKTVVKYPVNSSR